jgi:hypothetical protein
MHVFNFLIFFSTLIYLFTSELEMSNVNRAVNLSYAVTGATPDPVVVGVTQIGNVITLSVPTLTVDAASTVVLDPTGGDADLLARMTPAATVNLMTANDTPAVGSVVLATDNTLTYGADLAGAAFAGTEVIPAHVLVYRSTVVAGWDNQV